ncbi:MAG: lysozyme inhibitor LprI family protein [Gammaproteobacteria bacterium]
MVPVRTTVAVCFLISLAVAAPCGADQPPDCGFSGVAMPPDFAVLAGGEYSGRKLDVQIDQSGHQATRMDVVVNYRQKPLVLILGAYEPTIWNVRWSSGTRIVAVLIGGYHRQAVAGLPPSLPVRTRTHDGESRCGYFYVSRDKQPAVNSISRAVFGRDVEAFFPADDGVLVLGETPAPGEHMYSSDAVTVESLVDRGPLAGVAGLLDATRKGLIRPATVEDVQAWMQAVSAAGKATEPPHLFNAYVVLKEFTFPAGLYGANMATIFVPKGAPLPRGTPGHSQIYDFNSLSCLGPVCGSPTPAVPASAGRIGALTEAPPSNRLPGACSSLSAADSQRACLANELTSADDEINSVYQQLLQQVDSGARSNLRRQQRSWLKVRDSTCRLTSAIHDRSAWIAYVLADSARALCVTRFTRQRLAYLLTLREEAPNADRNGQAARIEPTFRPVRSNADYELQSTTAHERGKWYFEIQVDHGEAGDLQASLSIGVASGGETYDMLYHIRPQDILLPMGGGEQITIKGGKFGELRLPKVTIGAAIDLDNGEYYFRSDGQWRNGVPGSALGADIRTGRLFRASIVSSVPIDQLVNSSVLSINFGDRPFLEPIPDGYQPFDHAQIGSRRPVLLESAAIAPIGGLVAGKPWSYWIERYWIWLRSVPKSATPSADDSGARCHDRQSGPVWFLTGSAKGAVSRECEIPSDKYVLVPIAVVVAQPDNPSATCAQMRDTLESYVLEVTNLHLRVNGVALPDPTFYRAATDCFELNDVSNGVDGIAASGGYWAFLGPLRPGSYDVEFGGRFYKSGFEQKITYQLNVR